jgi:hypothetical protein
MAPARVRDHPTTDHSILRQSLAGVSNAESALPDGGRRAAPSRWQADLSIRVREVAEGSTPLDVVLLSGDGRPRRKGEVKRTHVAPDNRRSGGTAGRIRCLAVMPLVVGLVAVSAAEPATAAPKWQPIPSPGPTADSVCGFTIEHVPLKWDVRITTTTEPDGTIVASSEGVDIQSLTRVDTGETLVENFSGRGTQTFNPQTGVLTLDGRGTAGEDLLPGFPPFIITTGHLQWAEDASGNLIRYSLDGVLIDGCALFS